MSGHNKWAQIKHKKAISDAKKGKVFGKLARAISVAARGNPDPTTNSRLKSEIDRARAANMPLDNIERAVRRVSEGDQDALSSIQVELFGPGNAAMLVIAITDNSNRTINEIRQLCGKIGVRFASPGSVSWMFKKSGVVRVHPQNPEDLEKIELKAIDAGAEDVQSENGDLVIYCAAGITDELARVLGPAAEKSIEFLPTSATLITDGKTQKQLEDSLEALDDLDDVQGVYTNADFQT